MTGTERFDMMDMIAMDRMLQVLEQEVGDIRYDLHKRILALHAEEHPELKGVTWMQKVEKL
mgnify:CR=1 FL=1